MTVLGKRKASAPSISAEEANEIFRRHFEAQFAPLEASPRTDRPSRKDEEDESDSDDDNSDGEDVVSDGDSSSDEDEDEDDEWGGVSDDEDDEEDDDDTPQVQVVDHSVVQAPTEPKMTKKELRAFMSSKIADQSAPSRPSSTDQPSPSSSAATSNTLPEDAPSLLKQDLELRRLLAESHLLAPSHGSTSPFASSVVHGKVAAEPKAFAAGRTRQRATDMRIQALGSKTSILQQEKMPMNMRKGMVAAAGAREAKRRREAKENGIILERSAAGGSGAGKGKKQQRSRDRGVDGPGVGRMKGAQLRISERDVRSIEGGRDAFGRRSKRR